MFEQARQAFGFSIGQDQRIVLVPGVPAGGSHAPPGTVPADLTLPVLELDQVQATRGEYEQVDLVDGTLGRQKLDIRPGEIRICVRKQDLDVPQAGALVFPRASVDLLPARRIVPDLSSPPPMPRLTPRAATRQGQGPIHTVWRTSGYR